MTGPSGPVRTAARVPRIVRDVKVRDANARDADLPRDADAMRNETGDRGGNAAAKPGACARSAGAADRSEDTGEPVRPANSVYGALDLGTNNCRLLVAKPSRRGFVVIDAFSRIIRLGEGVQATGKLLVDFVMPIS